MSISKKKTIPKILKDHTWDKWIGDNIAKTKCMCCEINEIKMNNFHCGHVISEANGGSISIENLRPICSSCNLSMKTENMNDFKKRCSFGFNIYSKISSPEEFVMLGSVPSIVEGFDDQDDYILSKTKEENKFKVRNIIAQYGLTHSLDPIFKKFKNDYIGLKKALQFFSDRRNIELMELVKIYLI